MEQPTQHWTNDEFLAYTLLYSAHADYFFDDEEKDLILSKINNNIYENILQEISKDNDYQSLQKILSYTQEHKFSNNEIDLLLYEIELLFMCDGEYDILEKGNLVETCNTINDNAQYLSRTIDDFKNFIQGDNKKSSYNLREIVNSFINLVKNY